jgi:hypothetical protein
MVNWIWASMKRSTLVHFWQLDHQWVVNSWPTKIQKEEGNANSLSIVSWLVVWNIFSLYIYILGIIIPTDFHIFQRGRSFPKVTMVVSILWSKMLIHDDWMIWGTPILGNLQVVTPCNPTINANIWKLLFVPYLKIRLFITYQSPHHALYSSFATFQSHFFVKNRNIAAQSMILHI